MFTFQRMIRSRNLKKSLSFKVKGIGIIRSFDGFIYILKVKMRIQESFRTFLTKFSLSLSVSYKRRTTFSLFYIDIQIHFFNFSVCTELLTWLYCTSPGVKTVMWRTTWLLFAFEWINDNLFLSWKPCVCILDKIC